MANQPSLIDQAERFMALFSGLNRAYGTYDLSNPEVKGSGKTVGKAVTRLQPVTVELWADHLAGKKGIGIVPIRDDDSVEFGAIDVDGDKGNYLGFDFTKFAKRAADLKLPLVVCRSKSGGSHLFLFSETPVKASDMRNRLAEIAAMFGLPSDVEIFPKQSSIKANRDDVGSWINMPFFDVEKTNRYAVDSNGEQLTADRFLEVAATSKMPAEYFSAPLNLIALPAPASTFPKGPPCLNALILRGDGKVGEGLRNEFIANVVVMRKQEDPHTSKWKDQVKADNFLFCDPPLPASDVDEIIKSYGRKKYRYSCKRAPLDSVCDSAVCRTREFGVGRDDENGELPADNPPPRFPILGELRQLLTDPPLWYLDVKPDRSEWRTVELTDEQLQSPQLFQKRLMKYKVFIPIPTAASWQRMVQDLMDRSTDIEAPEDASEDGQFWDLLQQFCTKALARDRDEIVNGRPWTDEDGFTYFTAQSLERFLKQNHYLLPHRNKMFSFLRRKGGKNRNLMIRNVQKKVWGVPVFAQLEPRKENNCDDAGF